MSELLAPRARRRPLRLLLIGPLPPPVGGATVLFGQLVRELNGHPSVSVAVVNSSRGGGSAASVTAAGETLAILRQIRTADVVSFHSSRRGAALFGPLVHIVCGIFKKPWIFRGFGDFQTFDAAGGLRRILLRCGALRAARVLLETKSSVAYFTGRTTAARWYPNSRPLAPAAAPAPRGAAGLRFTYVGHVKPSKGVRELIAAAELVAGISVDVYGPLLEGMSVSEFGGVARYRGALEPQAVAAALRAHDVLVLPTYYDGEGYPGVIHEAFAAGLPVIATRWRAIPEIVTGDNGLLVEPRDVAALAAAMRRLAATPDELRRLRAGAARAAQTFSSERWTRYFLELASELQQ